MTTAEKFTILATELGEFQAIGGRWLLHDGQLVLTFPHNSDAADLLGSKIAALFKELNAIKVEPESNTRH